MKLNINKSSFNIEKLKNINREDIEKFIKSLTKENIHILFKLSLAVVGIIVLVIGYLFIDLFLIFQESKKNANSLQSISKYSFIKKDEPYLSQVLSKTWNDTIYSLIEQKIYFDNQLNLIKKKILSYQISYQYFLTHKLLPSLNIWKNPFTQKIDLTIVWDKFLDMKYNLFIDTNLIKYWTSFLTHSNIWQNNVLKDYTIWNIKPIWENKDYFTIPVKVKLEVPSEKNFIELINKLSVSSSRKNIMLLVEFFNHLFRAIDEVNQLDYNVIWYWLYNWMPNRFKYCVGKECKIYNGDKFINSNVVSIFIKNAAYCDNLNEKCLIDFRDKYRSLWTYIESISNSITFSKVGPNINLSNFKKSLKGYVSNLPFLLSVDKFVFKRKDNGGKNVYDVDISLSMYGKYITNSEVEEISRQILKKCFGESLFKKENKKISKFDLTFAKKYVEEKLKSLIESNSDAVKIYDYKLLLELIDNNLKTFDKIDNYKKTIRLIEIYRMFDDMNLCYNK